jgi:imidazoleglycerol phosphate synthase glutamine amidotransferase subunit HisH
MAREVTLVDAGLGNIASVERALIQVGAGVRITSDPDEVARARMVVFPGQSAFGAVTQAIVEGAMGAALKMAIGRGDPFLGICLGMQLLFDGSDENGGQEGLHVLPGRCRRFPDDMVVEAEPGATLADAEPAAPAASVEAAQSVASPSPASVGAMAATGTGWGDDDFGGIVAAATADLETSAVAPSVPTSSAAISDDAPVPERSGVKPDEELQRRLKVPHMGWNEVEPTGDHYYFVHSYYVEAERSDDVMWMTTYGGIRFPAAVRHGNVLGCQFHPEKSQRAGLKFLRAFLLGGWG